MKKILGIGLILTLALSLLTGCGGNDGDTAKNDSAGKTTINSATNEAKDTIMPSKIITLEDAKRILEIDMRVYGELDELEKGAFGGDSYKTCYTFAGKTNATAYMLQVSEASPMSRSLDEYKKEQESSKDKWIEGVGDWAMVTRSPLHIINVVYKGYSFKLTLTGNHKIRGDEEESAWKSKMLIEAGKCAVERLETIIK